MSYKPTPALLALWYRALDEEFGVEAVFSDPLMMNDLYQARVEANDPKLEALQVCQMRDGSYWIIKKEVTMEEPNVALD